MNAFSTEYPATGSKRHLRPLTPEEVRQAFTEHLEELEWLALFLTAHKVLANVCVVDACTLATIPNEVFVQGLERWARCCTIRSAIEMQQLRIAQLAPIYERTPCPHRKHHSLAPEVLDLLSARFEELGLGLDVLCRAALVLRGIEGYSPSDAALMLGVGETAVEAAYCEALLSLEMLSCEMLVDLQIRAQQCC